MARGLKTLAAALTASLALGAVAASSASATTAEFAGGPEAHGFDTPGGSHALTGIAGIECAAVTYHAAVVGPSTIDLTPTFSGCGLASGAPATVTHNGCYYRLTLGTFSELGSMTSAKLVCEPQTPGITMHFYEDEAHTQVTCTQETPGQTLAEGAPLTTENTEGGIRVRGLFNIASNLSGACMGGGTVAWPSAQRHVDLEVEGITVI